MRLFDAKILRIHMQRFERIELRAQFALKRLRRHRVRVRRDGQQEHALRRTRVQRHQSRIVAQQRDSAVGDVRGRGHKLRPPEHAAQFIYVHFALLI